MVSIYSSKYGFALERLYPIRYMSIATPPSTQPPVYSPTQVIPLDQSQDMSMDFSVSMSNTQMAAIGTQDFPKAFSSAAPTPAPTPALPAAPAPAQIPEEPPRDEPISPFSPCEDSDDDFHTIKLKKRSHFKRWFLTLFFEPTVSKEEMITRTRQNIAVIQHRLARAIACYDIAPKTNRGHIHIGFIFNTDITFETLQRVFGSKSHYECIRGSWDGVVLYIRGEGKEPFFELNIDPPESRFPKPKPRSATRSLFESVVKTKDARAALAAIEQPGNEVAAIHYRTAIQYIKDNWNPSTEPVFRLRVFICGLPGAGKTHLAYDLCRLGTRVSVVTFSAAGQMVGAQDNADVILFDDLNLSNRNIPREMLFQLFDRYELKIDVKGTTVNYSPKLVVITRCEFPWDFVSAFGWRETEAKQFSRRMDYIIRVAENKGERILYQVNSSTGAETPLGRDFFLFHVRGIMNQ